MNEKIAEVPTPNLVDARVREDRNVITEVGAIRLGGEKRN